MTNRRPRRPRYAISYTVKDEWRLLRHAVPYHLNNGCSRIYIFFDGTTDHSLLGLSDYPEVIARPSVSPDVIKTPPEWIREVSLQHQTNVDFRKRINTLHAAELAAAEGIEWISCIDADEIMQSDPDHGSIAEMLGSVGDAIDQVLMPNLELLPTPPYSDNPFADQTVFLQRKPVTHWLWRAINAVLGRVVRSPARMAKLESMYYRARFGGLFPNVMVSPLDGSPIHRGYFLGYTNHKAFIRADRARQFNFDIHHWGRIDRPARSRTLGRILHYDLPDFDYFIRKFQQRPKSMTQKAFPTRYELARIAVEADPATARRFYDQDVAVTDPDKLSKLIEAGIAARITSVADYFNRAQVTEPVVDAKEEQPVSA